MNGAVLTRQTTGGRTWLANFCVVLSALDEAQTVATGTSASRPTAGLLSLLGMLHVTRGGGAINCTGNPTIPGRAGCLEDVHVLPCPSTAPDAHQTAHCEAGYTGRGDASYVCGKTGAWGSGCLTCAAVSCAAGAPADSPHATHCNAGTFGQECGPLTCDAGFTTTGGTGSYDCTADGWQPVGGLVWQPFDM